MTSDGRRVVCVLPALNEELSVGLVVSSLPTSVDATIVVDNGSVDATARRAQEAGATVVYEPQRGYGAACLRGIDAAREAQADIIVFVDADFSDDPSDVQRVIDGLVINNADMCLGSRTLGRRERGSLTPQQQFGNALATHLIRWRWGVRYTDLGPLRAVTVPALMAMNMEDRSFGWTVEMQIKAAYQSLRVVELPVSYRRRIGTSKISGTVRGSVMAGIIILSTIARYAFRIS